jgi:hypothetical protein
MLPGIWLMVEISGEKRNMGNRTALNKAIIITFSDFFPSFVISFISEYVCMAVFDIK